MHQYRHGTRQQEHRRAFRQSSGVAGAGALSVLVFILLAGGVAYGLWHGGFGPTPARAAEYLTYRVRPIDLPVTAVETGTLESARSTPVYSEVEERVPIVSLVPEGTRVEAGDVVVELESASLKTRKTEQQILLEKARAAFSQAQRGSVVAASQNESDVQAAELAVEFAELDLKKYLEGDYPLELRGLQAEISLAEEELERARAPLRVLEELRSDGYLNDSEFEAERFRAVRAESRLTMAKDRIRVLENYSFPRQKRDLDAKVTEARRALERAKGLATAAVEQAQTNLKAEESALRLEEGKLARLEDQIAKCTLRAPQAGVVVYPFPEDNDMVELIIREGAEIRRRQHVFSIPETDVLQVRTALNEAIVNQVKPGMPTRIRIDVGDRELQGEVKRVSALADPQDWRRTKVKFYQTEIALVEQAEDLRPGMSAEVEIMIQRLTGVLALPVQSVVQRGDVGVCYALEGGVPVLRRLKLGKASVEHIAVLEGLREGELVLLSPDQIGIPADAFADKPGTGSSALDPAESEPASTTPAAGDPAGGAPSAPVVEEPVEEVEFKAVLLGSGSAMAEAEYEIQTQGGSELKRTFDVEVKGGEPNATWQVTLEGVLIGNVVLDATGAGLAKWSTKKGTMPAEFPYGATQDSRVTVGPELEGLLARN